MQTYYLIIPLIDGVILGNPSQSVDYVAYEKDVDVVAIPDLVDAERLVSSGEFKWLGPHP